MAVWMKPKATGTVTRGDAGTRARAVAQATPRFRADPADAMLRGSMKPRLWKIPASFVAVVVWSVVVRAQGTFLATNVAGQRTQPITGCDGKPLSNPNCVASILVRNPATGNYEGGLERIGSDGNAEAIGTVPVREGKLAGVFTFGTVRVPFVPAGKEAQVLLRVWDSTGGKEFAAATVRGETNLTVRLGGASSGGLQSFPGRLTSFRGLVVCDRAK
jgi:hypothetical protein